MIKEKDLMETVLSISKATEDNSSTNQIVYRNSVTEWQYKKIHKLWITVSCSTNNWRSSSDHKWDKNNNKAEPVDSVEEAFTLFSFELFSIVEILFLDLCW